MVCAAAVRTRSPSITHTPLITAWRRPASAPSISAAWPAIARLAEDPRAEATTVSTPSTGSSAGAIAAALR